MDITSRLAYFSTPSIIRRVDTLIGQTFSRLTVVARAVNLNHSVRYECRCTCGNTTVAYKSMLTSGRQKSCGCLKRERIIAQSTTHGHKPTNGATPTYNSWMNMLRRCNNPTHPRYKDWGGRGIIVCERWRGPNGFENFLADMGEKPRGMNLDREDNDGNYEPDNCRWATPALNQMNKRNTKLTTNVIARIKELSAEGMNIGEIARATNLNRHTVSKALFAG